MLRELIAADCFFVRSEPDLIAVEEKLTPKDQQPNPERNTQRAARNAAAEQGSTNGPSQSAGNKLQEQRLAEWKRKPMCTAAN